jgi:hypothetical protein
MVIINCNKINLKWSQINYKLFKKRYNKIRKIHLIKMRKRKEFYQILIRNSHKLNINYLLLKIKTKD